MTSRYFGLKNFGEIFGLLFSSMMLGVSLGPLAYGYCFDTTGNYTVVLSLSCLLLLSASVIIARLPNYPEFSKD